MQLSQEKLMIVKLLVDVLQYRISIMLPRSVQFVWIWHSILKTSLRQNTQKKIQITLWTCTDTRFKGTSKIIEGFFEFVWTPIFSTINLIPQKKELVQTQAEKKQGLTKLGKNKSFHTDFNQQLKSRSSGSYALLLNHMLRRFQC